jgi:homoserine dehydrogenase
VNQDGSKPRKSENGAGKSEVRVGLVGFGVVGTGLLQCLHRNRRQIDQRAGIPVRVKTIADLDTLTPRAADTSGIRLTTDAKEILEDPAIDVVVELVGGTTFAYDLISAALLAGKDVVTANKALLANRGHELFALAERQNRLLLFEAAVGGGIPIIQALRTGICSTEVERIYGILNGTANYILTRMEEGKLDFELALIEAKAKGYAEADPTYDIEGHDTTHKIILLSELAYGCKIRFEEVYREGITRLTFFDLEMARALGYRVKLLAITKKEGNGLDIRCHPALVPLTSQLAAVSGVFNAMVVVGNPLGPVMFYGQGAGGAATGAAVAADLMEAARQIVRGPDRRNYYTFDHQEIEVRPSGESTCACYLKLVVLDQPGVIAQISAILAEEKISIASMIQKEAHGRHQGVPVVFTTHKAPHASLVRALEKLSSLETVVEQPFLIRIEDLE